MKYEFLKYHDGSKFYPVNVADSLEEFLIKIQEDDNYYLEMLD